MIPVKQLISAAKTLSSTYLPPQVGNNLNWGFPQTDISAHQRQVDSTLRCVINQNKTKQNKKDTKHALQLFNFKCPTPSTLSACLSINNCRRLNTRKALIEYSKKTWTTRSSERRRVDTFCPEFLGFRNSQVAANESIKNIKTNWLWALS